MSGTPNVRGAGGEAWLLCPGGEPAAMLAAFGMLLPAPVLALDEPESVRFATALAQSGGSALERCAHTSPETLAHALEAALARSSGRVLWFAPAPTLAAMVAHALGLAAGGARALRIDPGRAFLSA